MAATKTKTKAKKGGSGVARLQVYPALNGYQVDVVHTDGRSETLVAEGTHGALMLLKELLPRFSREEGEGVDPAALALRALSALSRFSGVNLSAHKQRLETAMRSWAGRFALDAVEDVIDILEGRKAVRLQRAVSQAVILSDGPLPVPSDDVAEGTCGKRTPRSGSSG